MELPLLINPGLANYKKRDRTIGMELPLLIDPGLANCCAKVW